MIDDSELEGAADDRETRGLPIIVTKLARKAPD